MVYVFKKEDIIKLKAQINIDTDGAERLLLKHNGDIVECILDSYKFKDDKIDKHDKFTNIRNIVDEKNKIYNTNIENYNISNMINKNKIKVI